MNLRSLSGSLLTAACSRLRRPAAPMTRLEPVTARAEGRLAVVRTCTCHVSRVTCHVSHVTCIVTNPLTWTA